MVGDLHGIGMHCMPHKWNEVLCVEVLTWTGGAVVVNGQSSDWMKCWRTMEAEHDALKEGKTLVTFLH